MCFRIWDKNEEASCILKVLSRKSRDIRTLIKTLKPVYIKELDTHSIVAYRIKGESLVIIARGVIRERKYYALRYDHLSGLNLKVLEYEISCNNVPLFRIIWDKVVYKIVFNEKNPFAIVVNNISINDVSSILSLET